MHSLSNVCNVLRYCPGISTILPYYIIAVSGTETNNQIDPPDADHKREEFGFNAIRDERITNLERRICYNHTVYDDVRLELSEYAALTLEVQDLVSVGGPTTAKTDVTVSRAAIKITDDDSKFLSSE